MVTWYKILPNPRALKGYSVIAWRPIPLGTRILSEPPLVTIPFGPAATASSPPSTQDTSDTASHHGDYLENIGAHFRT